MAELGETFAFYGGRVDALDAIDILGACGKQGPVVVNPHGDPFFHQALTQFFHQSIVTPIDLGVAFGAHDGYFYINW